MSVGVHKSRKIVNTDNTSGSGSGSGGGDNYDDGVGIDRPAVLHKI